MQLNKSSLEFSILFLFPLFSHTKNQETKTTIKERKLFFLYTFQEIFYYFSFPRDLFLYFLFILMQKMQLCDAKKGNKLIEGCVVVSYFVGL